jgi:T4-like virus tail tube protein gp19
MPDNFKYPLPKFHFEVNWGGTRMGFTEVTGLDFETEIIEYREGNSPVYSKNAQPGLRSTATLRSSAAPCSKILNSSSSGRKQPSSRKATR